MAKLVEFLPSKCETLSSNISTTKEWGTIFSLYISISMNNLEFFCRESCLFPLVYLSTHFQAIPNL
jgi:hypothetical protein